MTNVANMDGALSLPVVPFSIAASIEEDGVTPRSSRATAVGCLDLNRLMSTLTFGTCPAANTVAKFARPNTLAVLVQAAPVFG